MSPQEESELQQELTKLRRKVETLETEKQLQGDEIRALKSEARSYQQEVSSLEIKVQSLEKQASQNTPATQIGKEVRLRYLEQHRQRIGKGIGKLGGERIKSGHRAAHRGRPVVDALLCLTGLNTDGNVYRDLYGVTAEEMEGWKDVPEIVEVTGFRGSLQSERRLTDGFQATFERLLGDARTYPSSKELTTAFAHDKTLHQLHADLQNCYDAIVAANPRGGNTGEQSR